MAQCFCEGSSEMLYRQLHNARRTAKDALLAEYGLQNVGQPMLLAILRRKPDGIADSQRELAEELHVTPATVTVSLRSMERDGYVKKIVDNNDMRRKRIALTDKGRKVLDKLDEVYERIGIATFDNFTTEEREQIADYFTRMIDNLNRTTAAAREAQKTNNP